MGDHETSNKQLETVGNPRENTYLQMQKAIILRTCNIAMKLVKQGESVEPISYLVFRKPVLNSLPPT